MGGEADSMSAAATTVSMCKTSWLIDDDGLDDFSCLPLFQLFFYGSCNHCPYSDCIFFWILFADSTHTHTLSLSLSLSLSLFCSLINQAIQSSIIIIIKSRIPYILSFFFSFFWSIL